MSELIVEQTPHEASSDHGHASVQARAENLKLAMWLYLGSEIIIFSVLIGAYLVFRLNYPELVRAAQESINVGLVGLNTFLLLGSSWAMVMGLLNIQRGNQAGLVRYISLTALLGTVFVVLQGVEYTELAHHGIAVYGNEFGMRFYAMTAFHGFHVIIGVLWALFVVFNARRGGYSAGNYAGVEVFGLYWHFVDVVWIFLFTFIYLF